jgi:hypothetical protein
MEKKTVPQIQVRSHVRSGAGGGYVNGVWYPDMSGVCGTSTTPPSQPPVATPPISPPTTGGGYVGGVWYPDRSGVCG